MNYRLWFYVTVIASFFLSGFLIGVTLHAQRVSDYAEQVNNDLKGTRYLMAANALKLLNERDELYRKIGDLHTEREYADSPIFARLVDLQVDLEQTRFIIIVRDEVSPILDSLLTNYPEIVDDSLRAIDPERVD